MHQTRQEITNKLPIQRKGTKYVVRAFSHHNDAVPVLIAIRDMLKLARTAKEVQEMIKQKSLKVNGKHVEDFHESIKLFNILEADKTYRLILSPTGKFAFEEYSSKDGRVCKVVGKKLLKNETIQINLHDGTNLVTKDKIAVGDSVYLDSSNKVKKHVQVSKGKEAIVITGKYMGSKATVESVDGKKVKVKIDGNSTTLENRSIVVL